jgi:hypothetical protein
MSKGARSTHHQISANPLQPRTLLHFFPSPISVPFPSFFGGTLKKQHETKKWKVPLQTIFWASTAFEFLIRDTTLPLSMVFAEVPLKIKLVPILYIFYLSAFRAVHFTKSSTASFQSFPLSSKSPQYFTSSPFLIRQDSVSYKMKHY